MQMRGPELRANRFFPCPGRSRCGFPGPPPPDPAGPSAPAARAAPRGAGSVGAAGLREGLPPALCALCCSQVLTLENWLLRTGSNFLMLFNTRYCIPIVKGPHPVLIQDLDTGSLWCYKHRFRSLTMY